MIAAEFERRLGALAQEAGVPVRTEWLQPLGRYYELLQHWNRRINLTALPLDGFPTPTLNRLLVEPLLGAVQLDDGPMIHLDVGSGGGSPAIPLKIVRPDLALTMIESRQRKAAFLQECIRQLRLDRADVLASRFEEIESSWEAKADLITLRAVRADPSLQTLVAKFLRPGGRLLAFGADADEFSSLRLINRVELPGSSVLMVMERAQ